MDQNQIRELRELIELLKASDVAEFDIEQPEFKVRLKFVGEHTATTAIDAGQLSRIVASMPQAASPAMSNDPSSSSEGQSVSSQAVDPVQETLHTVKSPIVGTFYESPSPGAPAFINLGDQVEVGQVLCIIEAMKLMNEIEADVAGEVVRRIAASGQPVEYGQPLFAIRPR